MTATRKPKPQPTAQVDPLANYDQPARWPHPGYDIFKATDKGTSPRWLVRCNAHGVFHGEQEIKAADVSGRGAGRKLWCAECAAAKPAPAKRSTAKAAPAVDVEAWAEQVKLTPAQQRKVAKAIEANKATTPAPAKRRGRRVNTAAETLAPVVPLAKPARRSSKTSAK